RPKEAEVLAFRGQQLHLLAQEAAGKKRAERLQLALAELNKAVERTRDSAPLWAELGTVQDKLGQYPAAIDSYTRSLKYDPNNLRVLAKRGWAWDNLKEPNWDAALKDFADCLALDRTDPEAHTGFGYFSACRKKTGGALRHAN